jgi:hypothetical protein
MKRRFRKHVARAASEDIVEIVRLSTSTRNNIEGNATYNKVINNKASNALFRNTAA